MDKKLKFKIVTPERLVHEDEVDSVSCPTALGEVTILPNHIPLVAAIVPGELRVVDGAETRSMAVLGGFLEVRSGDRVVILADSAEHASEIDLKRAEQARDRAKKTMAEESVDAEKYAAGQVALERSLARIRVANKRKKYKDVGRQP